ncbi:hypothetical protein ACFQPA_03065 [Halomarina halobia]|uniref:hypothetical protein n=1 Tax=Halomarina halobia TaxID=3033386 RepID=UPI0023E89D94|nr:hypothetical protein [Halomarina sp. PSR21]
MTPISRLVAVLPSADDTGCHGPAKRTSAACEAGAMTDSADSIREATTERERRDIGALQGQLFSDLDDGDVRAFFDDAYRAFYLYEGDAPVAVVGVSVRSVLHHERHVWVHDLVVDEANRGE